MKLLLDENMPHRMRDYLPGHDVFTAAFQGWASIKNGELLRLAADAGFDALISKDAGLEYQHDLAQLPLAIVLLRARSNNIRHIRPLIPALLSALESLQARSLVVVPPS